jgi:flagellar basal body rod protein FlgB
VADFQSALTRAIETRDDNDGQLVLEGRNVRTGPDGQVRFMPTPIPGHNLLFHDQANRQVEQQMAALAENTLMFNVTAELLRGQFEGLEKAIRQRM